MSAKAIREFHGKNILARHLIERSKGKIQLDNKRVHISPQSPSESPVKAALSQHPWLATDKLVVKPDQLIKRRGKSGLIKLNATWEECEQWLRERRGQEVRSSANISCSSKLSYRLSSDPLAQVDVSCVKGVLEYFLIEPFVPHQPTDEYYLAIRSGREGDEILFHHEGGVDVGDVDSKALVSTGQHTHIDGPYLDSFI